MSYIFGYNSDNLQKWNSFEVETIKIIWQKFPQYISISVYVCISILHSEMYITWECIKSWAGYFFTLVTDSKKHLDKEKATFPSTLLQENGILTPGLSFHNRLWEKTSHGRAFIIRITEPTQKNDTPSPASWYGQAPGIYYVKDISFDIITTTI